MQLLLVGSTQYIFRVSSQYGVHRVVKHFRLFVKGTTVVIRGLMTAISELLVTIEGTYLHCTLKFCVRGFRTKSLLDWEP